MVPFPHDKERSGAKRSAWDAADLLSRHPDGKGLILPPVKKETVEGTNSIWAEIAGTSHFDYAFPGNSTHYGLFRYYIRTWGVLRHRLSKGVVDQIVDQALQHNTFEGKTEWGGMQFKEWKRVDVKKAVEDAKNFVLNGYRFRDLPVEKRKQMAKELEVLIPVAAEVAGLIGEHGEKVARHMEWRYEDKYKNATTAKAFMDYLVQEGDPRLEIWQEYGPEEIKKIHKLHRLLYELTKPVSRAVFEKPSGWEDFLDERETEEVEREVQELMKRARGEVGMERSGAPAPATQIPQKAPAPPTQTTTVAPKPTGTPEKNPLEVRKEKERFTIDDVDMSKVEKHPETGLPIIRNGDQIVVLPPHKHPKEIPNLHPEAVAPRAYAIPMNLVKDYKNTKDAIVGTKEFINMMREYRERVQKGEDPENVAKDLYDKTLKRLEKLLPRVDDHHKMLIRRFLEDSSELAKDEYLRKKYGYTLDHHITEIAGTEVAMVEAMKTLEDMSKHPEKYGLKGDKTDIYYIAKMLKDLFYKKRKVVGFAHTRRAKMP